MIPLPPDIPDDTKPMNSSLEIIGGLAYKPTFDNMLMDAKPAKELEFIEINLMHHYILMKYLLTPGNTFLLILLDPYRNLQDTMQYWSLLTDFPK